MPAVQPQRPIRSEANQGRMGIIGLARAVDAIKCDAEIGLDHVHANLRLASRPTPLANGVTRRLRTGLDRPRAAAVNVFFAFG